MTGWDTPYGLLKEEFIQRTDEGCNVPADLRNRFAALADADPWDITLWTPLYEALAALSDDECLKVREPNDLESIRALRPDGPRNLNWNPSETELLDRVHGALATRCVGCALGKPVEGVGMTRDSDGRLTGRAKIRRRLQATNNWPLRDFFTHADIDDGIWECHSMRETIQYMESDDDIVYTVIGARVMQRGGPDFTWENVARTWRDLIPVSTICTAEIQAFLNFLNRTVHGHGPVTAEYTRRNWNPYREWIGAQIRIDAYAWACAGYPERAAEFAWRDSHWTHERNGIYGAMFCAALIAAAFVESNVETLIDIALSEIPAECRLAQWVREVRGWNEPDFESAMDRLDSQLNDMNPVHTINNALICVLALRYAGFDPLAAPATAVTGALDTDCNGATVGSIVGARLGFAQSQTPLLARLNNSMRPALVGVSELRISDVAAEIAGLRASMVA